MRISAGWRRLAVRPLRAQVQHYWRPEKGGKPDAGDPYDLEATRRRGLGSDRNPLRSQLLLSRVVREKM